MKLKKIRLGKKYFIKSFAYNYKGDAAKKRGQWIEFSDIVIRKNKPPRLYDKDGNWYDPSNVTDFSCVEMTCELCPLHIKKVNGNSDQTNIRGTETRSSSQGSSS